MLWRIGVGPGECENVVSEVASGGPNLLAVEDPLVTIEFGAEADVAEVGTGVRLGVALTPGVVAL